MTLHQRLADAGKTLDTRVQHPGQQGPAVGYHSYQHWEEEELGGQVPEHMDSATDVVSDSNPVQFQPVWMNNPVQFQPVWMNTSVQFQPVWMNTSVQFQPVWMNTSVESWPHASLLVSDNLEATFL